ncbi:Protein of unknown function [Flagellimonas taeanensis]|uniref:DinB superfamily protein n=2 Tax=Flagellimonas taeanensis TaxID=1005926 RepID=A0A1M6UIG2_9FLAO|nr:DUF1569 domain-containing protein [Allomuricauda taeanensis]SFC55914.1 Protein of unknown function [Allomuricauda taeanensis]SHK69025.1 Protein of unknown function [Allomuricauda taeanensis]
MKNIHDPVVREQLIERIEQLDGNKKAQWGKMTVFQMLRHNTYWNGWILGTEDHSYKQTFLGKIFGKMALKRTIKDEKPFDRNIPTPEQFKAKELYGDLEAEKAKWISLFHQYGNYSNPDFVHGFFGKMTKEQIGILVYKHTDHHLRQFGV